MAAAKETAIERIAIIPCHIPVHKRSPLSSSEHRLAMVKLAIKPYPQLFADDRELNRNRPSYSIDTLRELRRQHPTTPLCFFIGQDSFISLPTWHEWTALFDYCHLVVCARPGLPVELPKQVAQTLAARHITDNQLLHSALAGHIYLAQTPMLNISSTDLRHRLDNKSSTDGLIPPAVQAYIHQHKLYQLG